MTGRSVNRRGAHPYRAGRFTERDLGYELGFTALSPALGSPTPAALSPLPSPEIHTAPLCPDVPSDAGALTVTLVSPVCGGHGLP